MDQHHAETYQQYRSLLFTIAYQMTGSVEDAEDVVSEVFLRYQRSLDAGQEIHSPRGFLVTTTTRLCIDQLRSARHTRETYIGPWLPEPLVSDADSVEARAEMSDSLSMAFLVLLESLSPVERAAFLLREIFGYDYGEIAAITGKSEANCRQLVRRAKAHIEERKPRFEASRADRERIAYSFFAAADAGNLEVLESLLAGDAVAYGDGGGIGPSFPRPVCGRAKVARLMRGLANTMRDGGLVMTAVTVNGQPGAAVRDVDGHLVTVVSLDIADGQVQTIRSVVNPEKLRHLGPVLADPRAVLKRHG